MPDVSSTPSATTTAPETTALATGLQHGAHGAVTPSSSPVRDALLAMDSDQVRREAASCVRQRWPSVQRVVNGDYEITGFRLVGQITEDQRQEILSLSRALTRPCDMDLVKAELTRCLSLTKSRSKDECDIALMMGAMGAELVKYPADLVAWSLRKWAGASPWWPSLAEILLPIKRELGWRLSLADAANTRLKPVDPDAPKGKYTEATQAKFKEVMAKLKSEAASSRPKPVSLPDVSVPMDRKDVA